MVLLRRHHTACTEELDDEDLVEYLCNDEHEEHTEEQKRFFIPGETISA